MCLGSICLGALSVIEAVAGMLHLDLHFGADCAATLADIATLFPSSAG